MATITTTSGGKIRVVAYTGGDGEPVISLRVEYGSIFMPLDEAEALLADLQASIRDMLVEEAERRNAARKVEAAE